MAGLDETRAAYAHALQEACKACGGVVATLYRRGADGGYAPVAWEPRRETAAPPYVAGPSDVAAYLRKHAGVAFQMRIDTFRDGIVARGLEAFDAPFLYVVPLRGALSTQYYFTVATAEPATEEAVEQARRAADALGKRIEEAADAARAAGGLAAGPALDAFPAALHEDGLANPRQFAHILAFAAESDDFDALAALVADELGAYCVMMEDAAGLRVAASPSARDLPTAGEWLLDVARLPYLDWMEARQGPVAVPPACDEEGRGRVVVPVYDQGEFLGLTSIVGADQQRLACARDLRAAAHFACMHLLQRRRASRGRTLRRTLNSVENERLRVACELHDETSQNLVALKVRLSTCELALQRDDHEAATAILEDCNCIADEILDGVNRLSADLRPSELNYLGLRQAIEAEAANRLGRAGVAYEFSGNALDVRFNALQESMLLAGVVEALSNCAKHARATRVEISIDNDGGWLAVAVRDNGRGFDAAAYAAGAKHARNGLKTMRDCAEAVGGDCWVGAEQGAGTTVRFSVPLRALEGGADE